MRFSVVIPLHNKELFIARAIFSVLAQTFEDFELVIIDDGSNDASVQRVQDIRDNRIRLVPQRNRGAAAARNTGIKHSSGPLIAFLDADDTWEPTFLATIDRLTRHYPNAGFYATAYRVVEPDGLMRTPRFGVPRRFEGYLQSYFRAAAQGRAPAFSSAIAIPRSIFNTIGMFDTQMVVGEDNDMWARIALSRPVVFTTRVQATYHQDADPEHRLANVGPKAASYEAFQHSKALLSRLNSGQIPVATQAEVNYYLADRLLRTARTQVLSGHPDNAIATLDWLNTFNRQDLIARRWALRVIAAAIPNRLLAFARHIFRELRSRTSM